MKNLSDAITYETNALTQKTATLRPEFHVTPAVGWLNDPNGFSFYNGIYHLFYQYYPFTTRWGPMHWGHVTTTDFIQWKFLPAVLAPDHDYDGDGCFSGSAVSVDGIHYLIYTGVSVKDAGGTFYQTQCVAKGDGVSYEKLPQNPVIPSALVPKEASLQDFRDPKVWAENGRLYLVAVSCSKDKSGMILLYSCDQNDITNWRFESVLLKNNNRFGKIWECPDFFSLDGTDVVIVSPMDMTFKEYEYHSGNGCIYFTGTLDPETKEFTESHVASVDHGLDFYAPQSLLAEDGRRIMIGWMQSWDSYLTPEGFTWSGMMTVPRELSVKNGRLFQTPVRELSRYYKNTFMFSDVQVRDAVTLPGVAGRVADMTVTLNRCDCTRFRILLAKNTAFYTELMYEPASGVLTFDRTNSGLVRDAAMTRKIRLNPETHSQVTLRIVLDRYSVEVFANEGEQVMTSLIFTEQTAADIVFAAEGGEASIQVEFHALA